MTEEETACGIDPWVEELRHAQPPVLNTDITKPSPSAIEEDTGPVRDAQENMREEQELISAINFDEYEANLQGDPRTHTEALARPYLECKEWKDAMDGEIENLKRHDVLGKLVECLADTKAIGTRWVLTTKWDENGDFKSCKGRIVAQGQNQKEGEHYDQSFSPVIWPAALRVIIDVGACQGLEMHQLDIKAAYLHGIIDTELYLKQPPGYEVPGKEKLVYQLNHGLSGLKQSGRLWNKKLNGDLKSLGFANSPTDPCVYL